MPRYLADSSIWAWANKGSRPDIAEKLAQRLERAEICTGVPVALEMMHRAETGAEYESLFESLLAPLDWLPLDEDTSLRALQVQRALAAGTHGSHRHPAIDYLIAAMAQAAGDDVILWCFDKDLRAICDQTGQAYESEDSTGETS